MSGGHELGGAILGKGGGRRPWLCPFLLGRARAGDQRTRRRGARAPSRVPRRLLAAHPPARCWLAARAPPRPRPLRPRSAAGRARGRCPARLPPAAISSPHVPAPAIGCGRPRALCAQPAVAETPEHTHDACPRSIKRARVHRPKPPPSAAPSPR